jgi:8-oxo-dGTP pyrophosphatase MutT (NUDIX family)
MDKPNLVDIKHHFAGIFLVTESGKVVGQQRDNKPNIDNPNKVGTFGGTVEEGEEPLNAVWRELTQEETNLEIGINKIKHLLDDIAWRELTQEWEVRHFYYAFIDDKELEDFVVYEGQGWAYILGPEDPELIELWRPATKKLFETLGLLASS